MLEFDWTQAEQGQDLQHICPPGIPASDPVDQEDQLAIAEGGLTAFLRRLVSQLLDVYRGDLSGLGCTESGDSVVGQVAQSVAAGGAGGGHP